MRFTPPWSADPTSWHAQVGTVSTPGLDAACARPVAGRPPVVHRFHDLILLPHGPLDLPPMPPPSTHRAAADATGSAPPPSVVSSAGAAQTRVWAERRLRWGLFVAYEQAWHWEGSTLGELVESISLAPKEELQIQVYTWDRSKTSRDFESTDLVDQKSETSLTMHASAQVVRRMEKETHWNLGVNVGFSSGVTAGIEAGVGASSSNLMERRREQTQDMTTRTARQVRAERRVAISTVRETGIEERRTRTLHNCNETRTVTFNFYETLSHFRVEIAPVEATWVVAIPNALPAVTPTWVSCHEGILRDVLLDRTQAAGFDAARRLARRYPPDLVATAVQRMHDAFVAQPMIIHSPPRPWRAGPERPEPGAMPVREAEDRPTALEAFTRTFAAILTGGLSEFALGIASAAGAEGESPTQPYSFHFIESYLRGVAASPSVPGLVASMKLVNDWYQPFQRGDTTCVYRLSADAESALGYAYSVLVQSTGEFPPELSMPVGATEETQNTAREAWLEWKRERESTTQQLVADTALFEALRCHLEENLLHYLRAIWVTEDPGQRFARLSRELLMGSGEEAWVARLVEQPLLGFHLNCSVFALRLGQQLEAAIDDALGARERGGEFPQPEGVMAFAAGVSRSALALRARVGVHFAALSESRFRADGPRLLEMAIRDAVRQSQVCRSKEPFDAPSVEASAPWASSLDPNQLPDVLVQAQRNVDARLAQAREPGAYLSDAEGRMKAELDDHLDRLAALRVDAKATQDSVHEVVDGGNLVRRAVRERDFKPIMVTLPDGGCYCEPVLGTCSAVDALRGRQLEADTATREAKARQAATQVERGERRLAAGNLEADPVVPDIHVTLDKTS